MDYKGYSFRLCGVYKVENNKKIYALEIYQGTSRVYKSDWVYENEKRAYKDAKEMIRKKAFDDEIVKKNIDKELLKNDVIYKNQKINNFANRIIICALFFSMISLVIAAFGMGKWSVELLIIGILYIVFGLLMAGLMMYWGVFAKGAYKLNDRQVKGYRIIWWINLLFNRGPLVPYNEQPFEDKKKGWYSGSVLIALFFQFLLGSFLVVACWTTNHLGLTFYGIVCSFIFQCINYIFCVIWEISHAKIMDEFFPFKRVFGPLLAFALIIAFCVFCINM